MILAIDPGPFKSGYVRCEYTGVVVIGGTVENERILDLIGGSHVACEWIEHYGANITAGADVFHTCRWIGRFEQKAVSVGIPFHLVTRREAKLHLCGNMRAKDPHVRQALLDRYGGKAVAVGKKKEPGPLYGVSGHAWSALAVAVTYLDQRGEKA